MQAIMQVLGPEAVCACLGCQWETNEAIRLLKDAGIEYQLRKSSANGPHDPAKEQLGNEVTDAVVDAFLDTAPPSDQARLDRIRARFEEKKKR